MILISFKLTDEDSKFEEMRFRINKKHFFFNVKFENDVYDDD